MHRWLRRPNEVRDRMHAVRSFTVLVVGDDQPTRRSLLAALRQCRVQARESASRSPAGIPSGVDVVCADSSAATWVLVAHHPMVIVTRGIPVSDDVWGALIQRRPVIIKLADLEPVRLLEGLCCARFGIDAANPPPKLRQVPPGVLRAVLAGARTSNTASALARSARISVRELRRIERQLGLHRVEGLVTVIRAEMWKWLISAGVNRDVVEAYLGIVDRSNFRRACERAGIPIPWRVAGTDQDAG